MMGWRDGWVDGWVNGKTDRYTDGQADGWIVVWTAGWAGGRVNRWVDGYVNDSVWHFSSRILDFQGTLLAALPQLSFPLGTGEAGSLLAEEGCNLRARLLSRLSQLWLS